jgi:putative ABC transport system permease protein
MLVGDRTKYLALVFGFAFATLLMAQQSAFCIGLVSLAGNAVLDVPEADIWVMRKGTKTIESALPMPDSELQRIRGVIGVWQAVPMFRGAAAVRMPDGSSQAVAVVGVDDATLIGTPRQLLSGRQEDLRQPDAVFLNRQAYEKLFPGRSLEIGIGFELNDRRAVIRGIVQTRPWFANSNVLFTRYTTARSYVPSGRNSLSFALVRLQAGASASTVVAAIGSATSLKAVQGSAFAAENIADVVDNSGIVLAFGVVVVLGALVGAVIVGLTLSLFIRDNLKALGALKAIGVGNAAIVRMVLTQAFLAGLIGYAAGIGLTVGLIQALAQNVSDFSTFFVPWQVLAGSAVAVVAMTALAAIMSVSRVLNADPAEVLR